MAISIDGATKRIVLDSASVTAAEIWTAWVDWHPANSQWPLAFSLVGGIPLGGGLFIPPYFFLLNGWRVRPMESSHNLTITGNLFVDGGGVPVVSTLGTYQVNVNYTVPVQAQGIATSGSTGPTAAEIAAEVLSATIEGGMTMQEVLRIVLAVTAGDATGLEGSSMAFKSIDGTKDRVLATYGDGNRNVTSIDPT